MLLLSSGLALAGYFVGNTLYKSKIAMNTATVKGLAEKRVIADHASWRVGYTVAGSERSELPSLYKDASRIEEVIIKTLIESGLEAKEFSKGIVRHSTRELRNDDQELVERAHYLSGDISVTTTRVEMIKKIRLAVNQLIAQGISLSNHEPSYRYTKLNDIKPAMLAEATKNARIAADQFASNAGVEVGSIRSASQGGFSIIDVGERHGDTRRMEKDVRVVTTVEFYLTN